MSQFYFIVEGSMAGPRLPDAEAFFIGPREVKGMNTGWYWWACFPGCLPDGEPTGPFGTEYGAIKDAREPFLKET